LRFICVYVHGDHVTARFVGLWLHCE